MRIPSDALYYFPNELSLGTLDLSASVRWAEKTASHYANEKTQRGSGPRGHVSASLGLALQLPLLTGPITGCRTTPGLGRIRARLSFPQGPVFRQALGRPHTYLGWVSPAFSTGVLQSQCQLSAMVHSTLPSIPGLLSGAGLSSPWRSLVTGQRAKSLFAEPSTSFWPYP